MSTLFKVLVSVPPVLVAVWTFIHVNEAVGPWMQPIMDGCSEEGKSIGNPVVRFLSLLNCFLTPFFLEVLKTVEGQFIFANIWIVAVAFGGFSAVESSRLGARAPLSWQFLFTFFFQFVGISIGVPLLWLPSYFAVGLPYTLPVTSRMKSSLWRVAVIWGFGVFNAVLGALLLVPYPGKPETSFLVECVIWIPVVLPLLWLLVPVSPNCDSDEGRATVVNMHFFNAFLCCTAHVGLVAFLAANHSIPGALISLLKNHEGGASCAYFLLVDTIVFWLACLYQVLVEEGIIAVFVILLTTPFFGLGGPLCFYYMYRETVIWYVPEAQEAKKTQ